MTRDTSDASEPHPRGRHASLAAMVYGGALERHLVFAALVWAVLVLAVLSFLPILAMLRRSEGYGGTILDVYRGTSRALRDENARIHELQRTLMRQNQDLDAIYQEAEKARMYRNKLEVLQVKGRELATELLEMQAKEDMLAKALEQEKQRAQTRAEQSLQDLKRLNATYIRIFSEMKKKMEKLQSENAAQARINERLESQLEAGSSPCESGELQAKIRELTEKLRKCEASSSGGGDEEIEIEDAEFSALDSVQIGRDGEPKVGTTTDSSKLDDSESHETGFTYDNRYPSNPVRGSHSRQYHPDLGTQTRPNQFQQTGGESLDFTNPEFDEVRCGEKSFEYNTDRPGEYYYSQPATSARRCRSFCVDDNNCKIWVYVKARGMCYLKSVLLPPYRSSCCISGCIV